LAEQQRDRSYTAGEDEPERDLRTVPPFIAAWGLGRATNGTMSHNGG
jgi:hypothetical protein